MKSNLLFFLGLFAALGISWAGIVLGSNAQLGALAPYYDDTQGTSYPEWMPGVAARGQLVYRDLGCAACHTQQVRRPDFGSDRARGWGERQSVARDYIYQPFPQLGLSRIGPDLTNVGDRKPTAMDSDDLLTMLYSGTGGMPPYRFLFERRRLGSGAQPSDRALNLTGALRPKSGSEIVPTDRAVDLVGYLLSLKTTYDYPEAACLWSPLRRRRAKSPAAPHPPSRRHPFRRRLRRPTPTAAGAQPAAGAATASAAAPGVSPTPTGTATPTPTGGAR